MMHAHRAPTSMQSNLHRTDTKSGQTIHAKSPEELSPPVGIPEVPLRPLMIARVPTFLPPDTLMMPARQLVVRDVLRVRVHQAPNFTRMLLTDPYDHGFAHELGIIRTRNRPQRQQTVSELVRIHAPAFAHQGAPAGLEHMRFVSAEILLFLTVDAEHATIQLEAGHGGNVPESQHQAPEPTTLRKQP